LTYAKFRDKFDISHNLRTILADPYKFKDEVDDSLINEHVIFQRLM